MHGGLWRRTWQHDRLALAVIGLGSLVAAIAWRAITEPMGDTPSYRATALILRDGWPSLTERGPGYPLLLILTGSTSSSTHLLFVVQLLLHAATVVLVVDLARRADVGRWARTVLAVLLYAPPVLLRVRYEATEGLAALLLTLVAWVLLTPPRPERRAAWLVGLGALCGATGLVRPNYAVLFVPVAVLVAVAAGSRGHRVTAGATVALVGLALVGGWSLANGLRFDSYGPTPLTPYHLSAKTAPYVEELPLRYEPARSVLIRARDQALVEGEEYAPENFIWDARPALEEATGLHGRDLDRYVLEMDRELILRNPYAYLDTVKAASVPFSEMDSQPAVLGLGRPVAWAEQGLHLALLVAFLGLVALVPGLALAGQVARHRLRVWTVAIVLGATTWITVVTTESGTARLRAPAEPLLALALVLSASLARRAWRARRATTAGA